MKWYGGANKYKNLFVTDAAAGGNDEISVIDMTETLPEGILPAKTIAICKNTETKDAIDFIASTNVSHVVQVDENFNKQMATSIKIITDPEKYLFHPSECTLGPQKESRYFKMAISCSKEKRDVVEKLLKFAENLVSISSIRDSLALMADELITNAFFNAPTDSEEQHIYAHMKRTEIVQLAPNKCAEVFLTVAKDCLMIGCTDLYGSIQLEEFIKRLQKNYGDSKTFNMNMGHAGAGIGCRMMIDHSSSFSVVAKKNQRTVMSCTLPLAQSMKSLEARKKSLHFSFI